MRKLFSAPTLFIIAIPLLLLLLGCQKTERDPQPNPPSVTADSQYGTLYSYNVYNGIGGLAAIDLKNDTVAWNAKPHIYDNNSFLYENDIIYTSDLGGASAVDAKTGKLLWSTSFLAINISMSSVQTWNRPVIKDSFLYAMGIFDSEDQGLYCLNKRTGVILWYKNLTKGEFPRWEYSTPVVAGDKVVAISKTNNGSAVHLHCFNRITGAFVWYKPTSNQEWFYNAIPLNDNTVLLTNTASQFYTLNVNDGTLAYVYSSQPLGRLYLPTIPFLQNGELFVGTHQGIQIVDPTTWKLKRNIKDSLASFSVTAETIYYQKASGVIIACDINTLAKKWAWASPLTKSYNVADLASTVYSKRFCPISDDKVVYYYEYTYVLPGENSIFLLDAQTGTVLKEVKLPNTASNTRNLSYSPLVVKQGKALQSPFIADRIYRQ